ncbi:hypothetical protein ACIBHX_13895 [Nonomuraea sp. NPDC050536]|uniref:hypothetical protein n=1 Tax=Nonomuraea sp. NPDC050536 TaxID=3364366 RepID=UPI0037C7FB12
MIGPLGRGVAGLLSGGWIEELGFEVGDAATFVQAGINLESEGLFSGTRGQQIASRFVEQAS